jgi:hypothetical protein
MTLVLSLVQLGVGLIVVVRGVLSADIGVG